jgi:hypothetical protein
MKTTTKLRLVALVVSILLAGCDSSEVNTVKEAMVPQDQTHTYETALSGRASCDSEKWRAFEDSSNRTAVEYRCELKNGTELLAGLRARKINETRREYQNYYSAMDQRIEEAKQGPAFLEKQVADMQEKLARAQAQDAKDNQSRGSEDPSAAMMRARISNEMGAVGNARSSAERAQQRLDETKANLEQNLVSLQKEKERFQQSEKDILAGIEKTYGGVTKATEVFQWVVKGEEVFPSWAGVELQKQDDSIANLDKNWAMTIRDLLQYRSDDHVHYALNVPMDIVPGQLDATESEAVPAAKSIQQPGNSNEACYEAKLKAFHDGMGENAPVRTDVMNEWRGECGMPPL